LGEKNYQKRKPTKLNGRIGELSLLNPGSNPTLKDEGSLGKFRPPMGAPKLRRSAF